MHLKSDARVDDHLRSPQPKQSPSPRRYERLNYVDELEQLAGLEVGGSFAWKMGRGVRVSGARE